MLMYRFKNLLEKSPNVISAAIFATVNFIASCVFYAVGVEPSQAFGALVLSGETALVLILNLFVVQPNTVTNTQAAANVDAAVASRETEIVSYLAEVEPPNVEEKVAKKVAGTTKKAGPRKARG